MAEERNITSVPSPRETESVLAPNPINTQLGLNSVDNLSHLPISDVFKIPLDDIPVNDFLDEARQAEFAQEAKANAFFMPQGLNVLGKQPSITDKLKFESRNPAALLKKHNIELPGDPGPFKTQKPIRFSVADTGFDRYYEHPKFAAIGFTPYRSDLEDVYNANSSLSDDRSRMWGQFGGLFGSAFFSGYRAIGDFFDGSIGDPDIEGAMAMEEGMRIGSSSRGGFGASANNFLLNSAYTFGIIGSIAAEELALAMGSAAMTMTGVGAPTGIGAFVAGTARNLYRGGKAIANTFDIFRTAKATQRMLNNFNKVDSARKWWQAVRAGESGVGTFLAPDTMRALKELNSTKVAAQGLGNIGKGALLFGGFYRDLRALNLAIAEGKMESGMVYGNQLGNAYAIKANELGRDLTSEEFQGVHENASKAAFRTLQMNAPFIWLTNKLVLQKALSGRGGSLGRIFNEQLTNYGRRVLRTKPLRDAAGKASRDVFEDVGEGWLGLPSMKRIKSWTVGGTARAGAHGAIRYFAANFAEGFQEVYQEAVAVGTKDFYSQILEHPSAGHHQAMDHAFASAVDSQMSARGFETFMHGFLMGGLVQGPQRILFQGIPNMYNRTVNKEQFQEYQKQKNEYIEKLVEQYNKGYNEMLDSPDGQFNPDKLNFAVQHDTSKEMDVYNYEGDPLGFFDAKDFAQFQHSMTLFDNGRTHFYTDALKDLAQLSDEELMQAFPEGAKEEAAGKRRERLNNLINRIEKQEKRYRNHKNKYQNKYNPEKFKKGTREYTLELIKWRAYEHARFLNLFTEDGFQRALERSASIYNELATEPIFATEGAANDIQVLADAPTIQKEISLLEQEIQTLKDTKGNFRTDIANKKKKVKALQNYYDVITAPENQTKKGDRFSRSKKNIVKVRKAFLDYVNVLAEEKGTFKNTEAVDRALRLLLDYGTLKERTRAYDKAIEILRDPDNLDKLAERIEPIMANIFKNSRKTFRKIIKASVNDVEKNTLLNQLNKLGVVLDPQTAMQFLVTGDASVLQYFEDEAGQVTEETNPDKYAKIQDALSVYKQQAQTEEDVQEENVEPDVEAAEIQDTQAFENIDAQESKLPPIKKDEIQGSLESSLTKLYDKYKVNTLNTGEQPISETEWLNLASTRKAFYALQELRNMWMETLPTEEAVDESKFGEWLTQNSSKVGVRTILAKGGVNIADVVEQDLSQEGLDTVQSPTRKWVQKGPGINILEVTTEVNGKKEKTYRITDNFGKSLPGYMFTKANLSSIGVYTSQTKAHADWKTLMKQGSDTSTYVFDGVELKEGDVVYNSAGQGFYVLGSPTSLVDGNKISLLPFNAKRDDSILVQEVGFAKLYTKDKVNFREKIIENKANYSKVRPGELTGIYAHRNDGESKEDAEKRFRDLIDTIDINDLEITIGQNPAVSVPEKGWKIGDKLENPFIKKVNEKYTITLTYEGQPVAYMPNRQYLFVNQDNKRLSINDNPLSSLEYMFEGFADRNHILSEFNSSRSVVRIFDKLFADGKSSVSISELKDLGLNIKIQGESFDYNGPAVSVNEIENNTYDGNKFVLIRRTVNGKQVVTFESSLEKGSDAAQALYDKVIKDLKDNNLYKIALRTGYTAVMKRPDGTIKLAPLNLNPKEDIQEYFVKTIVQRALDTAKSNVDKKGKVKSNSYNTDWNKEIKADYYLAGKAGTQIAVQVTPYGSITLDMMGGKKVEIKANAIQKLIDGAIGETGATDVLASLITEYNKANPNNILSAESFKEPISETATVDEILDQTNTTVQFRQPKRKLHFSVDSTQADKDKIISTKVVKEETTKKEETLNIGKLDEIAAKSEQVSERQEQIEEFNKLQAQSQALKADIYKQAKEDGVSRKKALDENAEYQSLLKEVDDARKRLNDSSAYKILPAEFAEVETEKIDSFLSWAENNLPNFITIKDINEVGNRLKVNGMTVGKFVLALDSLAGGLDINGTIYVGDHGFRYHEAFHAVFRMLLSPEEQKQYLALAEKEVRAKLRSEGKSFEAEIQKFKNSADLYGSMSRKRLEQEFFEEYMADQFELFKKNPKDTQTASFIKSLFNRFIAWIKSVFGKYSKNELQSLYESIDAGKFKSRGTTENLYTDELINQGVTLDAYKLLPIKEIAGERTVDYEYLDPNISTFLVSSMAARFLQIKEQNPKKTLQDVEDQMYDEYYELYDPELSRYNDLSDELYDQLLEINKALMFEESPGSFPIIQAVRKQLEFYDLQYDKKADINEVIEENLGLRDVSDWDKDASLIGGASNIPTQIKQYIGTITVEDTDIFGNEFIVNQITGVGGEVVQEGSRLIVPVDVDRVYNGALKAVKNLNTPEDMLLALYYYGQDNMHTKAFVDRLFNDAGMSQEDVQMLIDNKQMPVQVNNPAFLIQVIKSFQNSRFNYLFVQKDPANNKTYLYDAASRDAAKSQINIWSAAYDVKLNEIKRNASSKSQATQTFDYAIGKLSRSRKSISEKALSKEAEIIREKLYNSTGILLSTGYIKYSMLVANEGKAILEPIKAQKTFIKQYQNVEPLSSKDFVTFRDIVGGATLKEDKSGNIFDKGIEGMESRLIKMAIANEQFDENVGASTYINADGNQVYLHQLPTFHSKMAVQMNDGDFIAELKEKYPNNYLLKSDAFNLLSETDQISILRIAGSRVASIEQSEAGQIIGDGGLVKQDSTTYGKQTAKEFLVNLINAYTYLYNTSNSENKTVKVNGEKIALAPSLIRVLEASNTGDMMVLPVTKTVEGTGSEMTIAVPVLDEFVDILRQEYNRIFKEVVEPTQDRIEGYNSDENGRAYKLFTSRGYLSEEVATELEEIANQGELSFEDAVKKLTTLKGKLYNHVQTNLMNEFDEFLDTIAQLKVEGSDIPVAATGLVNKSGKLDADVDLAMEQLNLKRSDASFNLAQIYFNDKLNTTAINQLLLGDESRTLKDAVDQVKRGKGQNAAHKNITVPFVAPELGINHKLSSFGVLPFNDPMYQRKADDKLSEETDAQVYMTTKGSRYSNFGMGRLNKGFAQLHDQVQSGEEVTADQFFGSEDIRGYVSDQHVMNSMKLVYFDGSTYIKMSAVALTPELTSLKDENGEYTIPKPNKVDLHNMRIKMEEYERANETVIFSAPTSALKMLKQNVLTHDQAFSASAIDKNNVTELSTDFMGLQVVNPSNKMQITSPTQMKTLITGEQKDNTKVTINGTEFTVKEIKEQYNKNNSQKILLSHIQKRNLLVDFDNLDGVKSDELLKPGVDLQLDLYNFLQYATESLKASQASSNIIEQFMTNEDGSMKYGLNTPNVIAKAEQLFMAYFSKSVMADKLPGTSLALMSGYGVKVYRKVLSLDENGNIDRQEIIREDVYHKQFGNEKPVLDISRDMDGLAGLIEASEGQGVIVLDKPRMGLKEYDSNGKYTGQRYSEFLMPAHHSEVVTGIKDTNASMPDAVAKAYGVRIPSQDNHSAINLKLIDFLPTYLGSTAIFPVDLLEISGADFDIDKLYTHFKEFYQRGNEFVEYGTNGYGDYIEYVNSKIKAKGNNIYKEALDKRNKGSETIELDDDNTASARTSGFELDSIKALKMLGMPITLDQYNTYVKTYGEPYAGALSNKDLDYKFALLGNDFVTTPRNIDGKNNVAISYEGTGLTRLTEIRKSLEVDAPEFAKRTADVKTDVNSLLGKTLSFKNNKEGADSIGVVVKPNLYYSLFAEFGIKLDPEYHFSINNSTFKTFGVDYVLENNRQNKKGDRIQYILSELITAMTDNAKERLASKLGLNKTALGYVTTMVSLGVPLETSIYFVNNPEVVALIEEGVSDFTINARIQALKAKPAKVTDGVLLKALNDKDITKSQTVGILRLLQKVNTITNHSINATALINLMQGHGKNLADIVGKESAASQLGLGLSNKEFKQHRIKGGKTVPFDVRKIFEGDSFHATNYKIHKEFKDILLPNILMTHSTDFKVMLATLGFNTKQLRENDIRKISTDLLSFLTITAYRNQLLNTEAKVGSGSLSNTMIYPNTITDENINVVVDRLKKLYKDEDNYFLDFFVYNRSFKDANNNTGLNTAVSNTFARLSDNQKIKLQNGFAKIYGEVNTKEDAIHILHYVMVKDGLQFAEGSLLEALTPFVMDRFIQNSEVVAKEFLSQKNDPNRVIDVFGKSIQELTKEFVEGYLKSSSSQSFVKTLYIPPSGSNVISINDKGLTIDFSAEGARASDLQTFEITPNGYIAPMYLRINKVLYELEDTGDRQDINIVNKKTNYLIVNSTGSTSQNGIGFMFDTVEFTRPTGKTIFETVVEKNKENDLEDFERAAGINDPNYFSGAEDIGFDGVNVQVNNTNISKFVSKLTKAQATALERAEQQVEGVEEFETGTAFEDDVETPSKLKALLKPKRSEMDVEKMTNYWNENIGPFNDRLAILADKEDINSFDDFLKKRKNLKFGISDDAFLENIKCTLKI